MKIQWNEKYEVAGWDDAMQFPIMHFIYFILVSRVNRANKKEKYVLPFSTLPIN